MDYNLLREHIGHDIVCVCYGLPDEDPVNIAIECKTCGCVIADVCQGDYYSKFLAEKDE